MAFYRVLAVAVLGSASMLGSASLLSGCGAFFVCEGKSDCPATGTGGTTNTGDFVYVSNSTTAQTYISGYTLTNGTLTAISGADIELGYVPIAMVVAPSNGFLYVASRGDAPSPGAGVYVYAISSTGALTAANNGNPFHTDQGISSMDISPDGNYLYTLSTSTLDGVILSEYQIDTTTGLPTVDNPTTINTLGTSCATIIPPSTTTLPLSQQCTVKASSDGNYVATALGSYGFEVFSAGSGGVTLTPTPQLSPSPSLSSADFSLAFDKNNYLYVASMSALTSFGGVGGTLGQIQSVTYSPVGSTPVTPRSVTVSANSGFVYTADEGTGMITGFSLPGSGVLTPFANTIVGPTSVSALAVDSTGNYLVAAGYNATNGLQVFSISSTGALTAAGTPQGTAPYDSTDPIPAVMALSH